MRLFGSKMYHGLVILGLYGFQAQHYGNCFVLSRLWEFEGEIRSEIILKLMSRVGRAEIKGDRVIEVCDQILRVI